MPVTPMLELFASDKNPILPVTGWMRLPEIHTIEVQAIYAAEVNDQDTTPDVAVSACLQFSADGRWSTSQWGTAGVTAFPGGYVDLPNEQWTLYQQILHLDDPRDPPGDTRPHLDGYTHVRLALDCKTNFSGTTLSTRRIAPFKAAVQYNVIRRRVQRVPLENRVVGNNAANWNEDFRLTGPITIDGMDSFAIRAILMIEDAADQGATLAVRPCYYYSDHPVNPATASGGWSVGGPMGSTDGTSSQHTPYVCDSEDVTGFAHPALAFGAQAKAGSSAYAVGWLSGYAEIYNK